MKQLPLLSTRATILFSTCLILIFSTLQARSLANAQDKKAPTHAEIAGKAALKTTADQLEETFITAHLDTKIEKGRNLLWCATIQLAWNELCTLAGGPIDLDGAPEIARSLNAQKVKSSDLDAKSFVAMAGKVEDGILEEIARALEEKFEGLASPELLPAPGALPASWWVTYAYLFKNLPFEFAFTRWSESVTFGQQDVAAFGIYQLYKGQTDEVKMATQVSVIDFKSNDDFLIELKTRSKEDRLILAKMAPAKTLAATIEKVHTRLAEGKTTTMSEMETLWIPVLDFDVLRDYTEIIGRTATPRNRSRDTARREKFSTMPIAVARQSIRFRLDETGAVLKSEFLGALGGRARAYLFDKPFLILLKRRGAKNPYFALWVDNAELLVPFAKKSAR